MIAPARTNPTPWHREPWPWLLMAAPLMSIIGGITILCVSLASNDGLVADDYYKQGLAINQQLTRERAAAAGHYRAHVLFTPSLDRVRITFAGDVRPDVLVMRFNHSTRAGFDRVVMLKPTSGNTYEAELPPLAPGRWHVAIEDDRSSWRLTGEWQAPQELSLSFPARPKEG